MTPPKFRVEEGWRYDAAGASAVALEALLRKHGIIVAPGSALELHLLNVLHLVDKKKRGNVAIDDDVRPIYRTLIGVHELASLLLAIQDSPLFGSLVPHLRLLNEGEALQNTWSNGRDQATNKLFELYMGAVALQCGKDLVLDHPVASTGDNPDVLVTIAGRRWGIACKVLHGKSPQGFVEHLTKGIDQIDRSEADVGIVAFNLKNVLPHDEIWPLAPLDGVADNPMTTGAWSDAAAPSHILFGEMDRIGKELVSYLPPDHLQLLFHGRKSLPGFLLWGASASAILINDRPTASSVRALNFQAVDDVSPADVRVLGCLNWGIYADSANRGSRPCP